MAKPATLLPLKSNPQPTGTSGHAPRLEGKSGKSQTFLPRHFVYGARPTSTPCQNGPDGRFVRFPIEKREENLHMKSVKHLGLILVFLCALPIAALAQVGGSIDGTITDPNGAVVPGAKVTATQVATGVQNHRRNDPSRSVRISPSPDRSLHDYGDPDRDSRPLSEKALKFAWD